MIWRSEFRTRQTFRGLPFLHSGFLLVAYATRACHVGQTAAYAVKGKTSCQLT
jgi:hypothetical protein